MTRRAAAALSAKARAPRFHRHDPARGTQETSIG